MRELSVLGRFSTPLFSLLAAFFLVRHFRARADGAIRKFVRARVVRIVVPFLAWSVLYYLSRDLNFLLFGKVTTLKIDWNLLWSGTTYHLWFLPFLMVMSVLSLPGILAVLGNRRAEVAAAVALFGGGIALTLTSHASYLPETLRDPFSFAQVLYYRSPAFLWGLALGLACRSGAPPRVGRWGVLAVGVTVAMCLVGYLAAVMARWVPSEATGLGVSSPILLIRLAAVGIMVIAFANWRGELVTRLSSLGRLSYGVYLSHVLFIEFAHAIRIAVQTRVFGMSEPKATAATDIAVFVFALIASLAASWALRRNRSTRWLIP